MTARTEHQTEPKRPGAGAGTWFLICAVLLCPLTKIVTLTAFGSVLGGLLGMPWLLAIAGIAIAGSGWILVRTLRGRAARCQPPAKPPGPGPGPDPDDR